MDPKLFIENCFPKKVQMEFLSCVRDGYKLADSMYELLPVKAKYFDEFRVRAINYTVEATLIYAVKQNKIPFNWIEERNSANNCSHLKLHRDDVILTVSQVERRRLMPREAVFRTYHSQGNQMSLFEELLGEIPYVILTHGYKSKEPKFAMLGMPEPPSAMGWAGEPIDITDSIVVGSIEERIPEKDAFKMKNEVLERLSRE